MRREERANSPASQRRTTPFRCDQPAIEQTAQNESCAIQPDREKDNMTIQIPLAGHVWLFTYRTTSQSQER